MLAGACCVSAALSEGDRAVLHGAEKPPLETDVVFVELDPHVHQLHYEVVSNEILWFLFHGLFDLIRNPTFDESFSVAWDAYVTVNQAFADAVIAHAPTGDTVLVQDYPLALVPGMVRAARPDLVDVVLHAHAVLRAELDPGAPRPRRRGDLRVARLGARGLPHHPVGTRVHRIGPRGARPRPRPGNRGSPRHSDPIPTPSPAYAASDAVVEAAKEFDALAGDRKLIFRTDRIDPAKNIVRGFIAYDHLLADATGVAREGGLRRDAHRVAREPRRVRDVSAGGRRDRGRA